MAKIYVSGLINTETTVPVRQFPVEYYPIDYPFFGINTQVSGVAYNIARALAVLGDEVKLATLIGQDAQGAVIRHQLQKDGLDSPLVQEVLPVSASSVVLYDPTGRRQIYCDLKDIQDRHYPCSPEEIRDQDIIVACNINFNRSLLEEAARQGKLIATDVHVLGTVEDEYNRAFLETAQILFLSDEGLPCEPREFLLQLARRYGSRIIVLGRGARGAMLYVREWDRILELPCVKSDRVVNTVGAGDALFSGFLHFYSAGMDPVEALWHAQVFASAKIETSGAAQGFISAEEVVRRRREL